MAWSTREIAELAGTSLRAVRHYHEVGLLDEPERRANGYKQYGVAHLVRLLRIKRLVDLGFPLSQIAEMGEAGDHPEEALRTLDAKHDEQLDGLYSDARGDILAAAGKLPEARAAYQEALLKLDPKGQHRTLVQLKIDSLGDGK